MFLHGVKKPGHERVDEGLKMVSCIIHIIILLFLSPPVQAGDYLDSAHGSNSAGVKRDVPGYVGVTDYARGNCAHCHEQHSMLVGAEPQPAADSPSSWCLFADNFDTAATANPYVQDSSFCFYCHYGVGSLQDGSFVNYGYSITFGGYTDTSPSSIFQAFNSLSYHNLKDLYEFITGTGTRGASHTNFSNFPAKSSPCAGCHNVHIAKRNKENPGNPAYSAISLPSDHGNILGDDDPNERMTKTSYGSGYQSPRCYNSSNLEPDCASSTQSVQAAKTPDYIGLCTDCHDAFNNIPSYVLGRVTYPIDWAVEKHGSGNAADDVGFIDLLSPYLETQRYILACTDCHEPHGSPNIFLARQEVNGSSASVPSSTANSGKVWLSFCDNCHGDLDKGAHVHPIILPWETECSFVVCHMYEGLMYRPCDQCHYHGNSSIDGKNYGEPLF